MPNKKSAAFSARTRLIVVAISACFTTAPAWSNPTAPQVVNGSASFNQTGKLLTVTNSNGAIINWNTFSIGANETTRFNQGSANSSVLNRVLANDPSVLLGALSSNGRVWLVNPAGIMVGQGARIDVGGFVASTLNVRNEDFLAGRLNFGATPNAGKIENHGRITTPSGGSVYLVAPAVANHGIINAPNGEVILAAGQTAQLIDTGTPGIKIDITGAEGNVTNLGEIVAEAGRIGLAGVLVQNSGTLNASSITKEGGRIFLKASGDAYVDGAGRIDATGTKGGSIEVLGNRVAVMDQARLNASGDTAGGTVLVGGDYQGKNPNVQNAERTLIGPDTVIRADARTSGDGGRVIAWADGDTRFYGSISAKGGAQSGDGGFAEVSGRQYLDYRGRANLTAPLGKTGTLLLDPEDIVIIHGVAQELNSYTDPRFDSASDIAPVTPATFRSIGSGTSTILTDGSINAQLDFANVLVQTGGSGTSLGDITFNSYLSPILLGPTIGYLARNLTFDATHNISFINGTTSVALNGGQLTLRAQTGSITTSAGISTEIGGNGALALNSAALLMIAGSGIGSSDTPLRTTGLTDLAARTAAGGIFIANNSGSNVNITTLTGADLDDHSHPKTATGVTTTDGEINIASLGIYNTGSITVSSDISSGVAPTTLTAGNQINSGGGTIFAHDLVLSAVNGIGAGTEGSGLQTQVTNLQATNTNNGIAIANTGDLVLKDLVGVGHAVSNTYGGVNISATSSETATGRITVSDMVTAGRKISLRADGDLPINADLSANTTGWGQSSVLVADANNDGLGSITQSAGTVITTHGSNLDIGIENILGSGADAFGSGQHIVLGGTVDAGGSRITIRNESGFISTNGTGLITVDSLGMRSQQGIDVDTSVNVIAARNGGNNQLKPPGSGDIAIRNTNDGTLRVQQSFFETGNAALQNRNGNISVSNDGSIYISSNVDSATARTTLSAGNTIDSGEGFGTIFAGDLVLSAVNGIGAGPYNMLRTQVTNLQATNTNNGIAISNTGDLTLKDLESVGYAVHNTNGAVLITAQAGNEQPGKLTVSNSVTAGQQFSLRADGDLFINANVSGIGLGDSISNFTSELIADAGRHGTGGITQNATSQITMTEGGNLNLGVGCAPGGECGHGSGGTTQNIVLGTVNAGTGTVMIRTENGGVQDANGAGLNITARDLVIRSEQGIDLDTAVSRVNLFNGEFSLAGNIAIRNTGDLAVVPIVFGRGVENQGGSVTLSASGSLTIPSDSSVSASGNIDLVTGNVFTNNNGADALSAGGHWDIWVADPTKLSLGGLTEDFRQYNAIFGTTPVQTTTPGNGLLFSVAPSVSPTLSGTTSRAYDGTTNATDLVLSAEGAFSGDSIAFSALGGTYQYVDRNVGIHKPLDANTVSVTVTNGAVPVYGYQFDLKGGDVTRRPVTLTAPVVTKTYNGDATYSTQTTDLASLSGALVGGDTVSAAAIAYTNKNAGTGTKTVTFDAATINDGNNGANYAVTLAGNNASSINPLAVMLAAPAVTKSYDGSNGYTAKTADLTALSGQLVGGDTVSAAAIAYTNKNAGTGTKTVTFDAATINDGNNGANYAVTLAGNNASTINPLAVTLAAPAVTKTYDGNTAHTTQTAELTAFSGQLVGGDTVSAAAIAYTNKNAGTGTKTVTFDAATINDGNNGANYAVTLAGNNASTINPLAVTLAAPAVTKTYDGNTAHTTQTAELTAFSGQLVGGDTVSAAKIVYTDKNAGTGNKTVTFDAATINDGNGGANYAVTLAGNSLSTITVRPLSTWIGGATGNWSLASNWDALPDLSNVLAVSVPTGKSVTYDAAAGSTNLASLTAAGLSIAGGNLNIANSLTVNSSFSQTGGALVFGSGASANITQASGNLNLPAFTVANLSLNAPTGTITQSGRIAVSTLKTQSQGATSLDNPDNQVSGRVDMTAGGPLKLSASGDLNLGGINAAGNPVEIKAGHDVIFADGNVVATNAAISAGHDISAAITVDLRLDGSGLTAGNDIFINMLGATSTLYLNDAAGLPRAFLWAQAPSTIHLDFPARASGGMVVNGKAVDPLTFAAAAGASGLFYGAAMAPATLGTGLEVVYNDGTAVPGTATTVAPSVANAVIAAISASTQTVIGPPPSTTLDDSQRPRTGLGGTPGSDQIGGTEGTFGSSASTKKDEREDKDKKDAEVGLKKQADKPAAKRLATCS